MRVLLLIPINRTYVVMPSLGLGYIASVLKRAGHQVTILHCAKEKFGLADFERYLGEHDFDLIGIQMFTYDLNPVRQHLAIIKQQRPRAITVLGGYHPSGDPAGVLVDIPGADFAFASEVELALPKFMEEIVRARPDLAAVPNLIWRRDGGIVVNPVKIVDRLDDIPFPAWELMDPKTYPESPHGGFFRSWPTAPIIITRGCPMQCTFCAGKSVTTDKVRARSVANVIAEVELLKRQYGVNDLLLEDENFTLHKKVVHAFCEALLAKDLKMTWSCPAGVRLDTLDLEMLKLMERAGCHSLAVGVEFGSQRIHDLTKKRLTLGKIKEKMELFRHVGIKTTGFFMFGIPGETKEEMKQTIKFAKELNLDRAQFNNFMPLPGSELYRQMKAKGRAVIDHDHFFVHDVGYVPEGMTKDEIKNCQRQAYLSFYLRPKIIFNLLKQIVSLKQFVRLVRHFIDGLH